jgi:hypothetical protein
MTLFPCAANPAPGAETMKIFDVIDQLIAAIPLTPEEGGQDARRAPRARDKEDDTAAITAYALPDT